MDFGAKFLPLIYNFLLTNPDDNGITHFDNDICHTDK